VRCARQLVEDSNGNVKIVSSNAGKEFAAEEISAQVLRKLVDDASKFLNDKVPASSPWPPQPDMVCKC
jgi:molecular chaperone DnaK (HSP70)